MEGSAAKGGSWFIDRRNLHRKICEIYNKNWMKVLIILKTFPFLETEQRKENYSTNSFKAAKHTRREEEVNLK